MIRFLLLLIATILVVASPGAAQIQITADFNGDGAEDLAELVFNSQLFSADLLIATATQTHRFPQIAYSGAMEGQEASLTLAQDGALEVHSGNRSMGRDRWDQTLTIVWGGEGFLLAGIKRAWWDTLTPDSDGNCDVNLLTGKGLANGPEGAREIRLEAPAPALADWDQALPEGCEG
ncbi:MAG: hypothetical protein NXH97_15485 [Rhodobacteraceae bacterium]|nr:hypothetical protein [Paracoccaceae bacterium]